MSSIILNAHELGWTPPVFQYTDVSLTYNYVNRRGYQRRGHYYIGTLEAIIVVRQDFSHVNEHVCAFFESFQDFSVGVRNLIFPELSLPHPHASEYNTFEVEALGQFHLLCLGNVGEILEGYAHQQIWWAVRSVLHELLLTYTHRCAFMQLRDFIHEFRQVYPDAPSRSTGFYA